jgi:hypothetical protein
MTQDENPNDDFDAKLNRLFAEKNESLPADEFMTHVLPRLERAYRAQQLRRILLIIVVLIVAAVVAPLITKMTMDVLLLAGGIAVTPVMIGIAGVSMLVITLGVFVWSRKQI